MRRSRVGATFRKGIGPRSQLHAEIAVRRCVHLLTSSVVANPLNKHIVGNRSAVVGCNASPEKHHKILSRSTWLQTPGRGSRRRAWGRGRWRRWSRGLLRHCVWCQQCRDGQQEENAHAVAHRPMPKDALRRLDAHAGTWSAVIGNRENPRRATTKFHGLSIQRWVRRIEKECCDCYSSGFSSVRPARFLLSSSTEIL